MQKGSLLRRCSLGVAVAALALLSTLLVASPAARAGVPAQIISSGGPLSEIYLGNELSCQIAHTADTDFEFYPPSTAPGDCGTFLVVSDVLYAPDYASHGGTATGSIGTYTAFTPVTQSAVSGSGTSGDPYQVVTEVDVGATGLSITQTDRYVVGQESYRTDVQVSNSSGSSQDVILYRAADCFLGGSDAGYGFVVPAAGAVACSINPNNMPPDRIEQWLPITGGNNYYQAHYSEVWAAVGTHAPFNDTCRCDEQIDNGGGISWSLSVPAGGQVTRSHLTTFSPTGELPLTMSKTADSDTSSQGTTNGYTITINNPNISAVNVSSITDDLPAGFAYVSGSTTGVTTDDPSVAGQTLTWSGPFSVPGSGSISLHFEVTVSSEPGEYFNNASADAGDFAVAPTGDTAPITVTTGPGVPTPTSTPPSGETPAASPTDTPPAAATAAAPTVVTLPDTGASDAGDGGVPGWLLAVLAGSALAAAAGYVALRLKAR